MNNFNKRIEFHVEATTRSDILGESFLLPYSEQLENAIMLINLECSKEVKRRSNYEEEEFLVKKYQELRSNIESGHKCKEVLKSIGDYFRGRR